MPEPVTLPAVSTLALLAVVGMTAIVTRSCAQRSGTKQEVVLTLSQASARKTNLTCTSTSQPHALVGLAVGPRFVRFRLDFALTGRSSTCNWHCQDPLR